MIIRYNKFSTNEDIIQKNEVITVFMGYLLVSF